ncbi:MAG: hypothetical protein MUP22_01180 [Desulfobacterales bacterium]|nr:hypothetical protein [Desulfobacterales bacterium]
MKKTSYILVGFIFLAFVLIAASSAQERSQLNPTVVSASPMIMLSKNAQVVIIGSGVEPGQEVRILFKPLDGLLTDIGDYLDQKPVPDKNGNWVTTWTCGSHLKNDITESAYSIIVSTMEYIPLAHTPIIFYKEKTEKKK